MKRIILFLLFASLPGCAFLKRSGEVVCDAHHTVAAGVESAGSYLGGPGNLVADIVNAGLEMFCKVFKAILSAPADIADGPGTPEVTDEGKVEDAHHE